MKMIQLRGTNATGKTTAVRQFVFRGGFCVREMPNAGRQIEYHWNEERRIAVLGRYDKRECGGIDGYIEYRDELLDIIAKMMRTIRPEVIIYEGIAMATTFKLAHDIAMLCKRTGYEFVAVCLEPPLEVAFERLAGRNGGRPVNYMKVQEKWFSAARANEKLEAAGLHVVRFDTSRIPKEDMWKIIEGVL